MKSTEIRKRFLDFFAQRGHEVVASSPLIPFGDPTLLFTNAGMNQFKGVFLGQERRAVPRAASAQKCMRVSGKHNDLENVGRTPRHHTFFEMLGNFSFGDYFKKEAVVFAWEFLTKEMGMDPARMWATVYEEDEDAHKIWLSLGVLPRERILKLGKDDNFWAMGETGPCGPCSEIHYDFGDARGGMESDFMKGSASGQIIEIWNLVFMQFDRQPDGKLSPLAKPSIDTGMGLERLSAVVQGVRSNYETDLFTPLLRKIEEISGKALSEQTRVSMNVAADHVRALTFLISDGVIPSNEGRGYVLRKIMRRAMKHGRYLGMEEPFLYQLVPTVAEVMHEAYPELLKARPYVQDVCASEERRFADTLAMGMNLLEDLFAKLSKKSEKTIPGAEAFRLYDTYGFPLDLTQDIAADRGFTVDAQGFEMEMEKQKEAARKSWKGAGPARAAGPYAEMAASGQCAFLGYENLFVDGGEIQAIIRNGARQNILKAGEEAEIVLDRTPFYAESGGQVGDRGTLSQADALFEVTDTQSPMEGLIVHKGRLVSGTLKTGDKVAAKVDVEARRGAMAHHTATHLLHAALREALGEHVRQAGSLVAPDRLRFDFSHFKPVPREVLREIEEKVNAEIRADKTLRVQEMALDDALARGAMALFGERYGNRVRVVEVPGFSVELCGGTHTRTTGEIGVFKFTEEGAVAAGVRRVEALTGKSALHRIQQDWDTLTQAGSQLNVPRTEVLKRIESMREKLEAQERELARLRLAAASGGVADGGEDVRSVAGVKVAARLVDGFDADTLRQLADRLLGQMGEGVAVLGNREDGKATLLVAVSRNLQGRLPAGELVKRLAPFMDGKGGGKSAMAQAGSKSPEKLAQTLEKAYIEILSLLQNKE